MAKMSVCVIDEDEVINKTFRDQYSYT